MNAVVFFDAIKQGDLPRVQQLVHINPSILRTRGYLEHTPLIAAMFHGRWDVAEYLMQQKGIDVNAKDIMGRTALYYVCCRGRPLRLLEALVDAGADVTMQTDILHGSTLITRAVRTGREDVLTFLLERFCGVIDIDATGSVRESALSVACWDGRLDAVKILLQYGADPRVPAGENSPLVVAQRRQHHQIITLVRAALVEPERPRLLHKARFLLDAADSMRRTMPACLWPRQPWVEIGRAATLAMSTLATATTGATSTTNKSMKTRRMATFKAAAAAAGAAAAAAAATAGPGGRRNKEQEEAEEERLLAVIQYVVGKDENGRKGGMIDVLFFDLMGMLLPRWDSERKRT
jgi:hypothetical protein